jgi:hypothetical protein
MSGTTEPRTGYLFTVCALDQDVARSAAGSPRDQGADGLAALEVDEHGTIIGTR